MQIMTLGYEGATPEAFDRALIDAQVDLVVDVRAMAISRRRGFAKTALASRLASHGIGYVHLRGLGDPKPGREAARMGDWSRFQLIFNAHMKTEAAQNDLERLVALAAAHRVALVCYEADARECHRTVVARAVASHQDIAIVHLGIADGASRVERYRTNDRIGEGLAAA